MIEIERVLRIHETLVKVKGGASGIRDQNLLISSLSRPFSGFGNEEFYPSPEEKAAAVFESIVKNHPFIDGNKRTGYYLLRSMLLYGGKDLTATQDEKYDFVIKVASGELDFIAILNWIKSNTRLL